MNELVVFGLVFVIGAGSGFAAVVATRRYGLALAVGVLVVLSLYLAYVLTTGEGAPFVPYVMVWGGVGVAVLFGGFVFGIAAARRWLEISSSAAAE